MKFRTGVQFAVLAAVCALGGTVGQLGCSAILGLEDTTLRGGNGPLLVQVTQGWFAADGGYTKTFPTGSATDPLRALDPNSVDVLVWADGKFLGPFYTTTSTPDGLLFDALPAGERYVRIADPSNGTSTYVAHGHRLDVGTDTFGRPDPVLASEPMILQIIGTNVSDAGSSNDQLGGTISKSLYGDDAGRSPWTTPFYQNDPLLDLSRGDVAWVARDTPDPDAHHFETCRFPDGYRMQDQQNSVNVTCSTILFKQHLSVNVLGSDFARAAHANGETDPLRAWLRVGPGTGKLDWWVDQVASSSLPRPETQTWDVDFVNPAPTTWPVSVSILLLASRSDSLGDGGVTSGFTSNGATSVVSGASATVGPVLGALSGVTVGGKDVLYNGFVSGLGPEPIVVTLTPAPPSADLALLAPTHYEIAVLDAKSATVADIRSSRPEVALPPGVVEKGKQYSLLVTASYSSQYSEEEPRRGAASASSVATTTNSFTP